MKTLVIGILLTLCASELTFAQDCLDCSHNQLGQPICVATVNCKCFCQIITMQPSGVKSCFSGQICVLGGCVELVEQSKLSPSEKLANDVVAHPWIMDTSAAGAIRASSGAMAAVFEIVQQVIKEKHLMDGTGWMSTNKDNEADPNGWVRYDLISKTNGMDEIRLTYEVSLVQEQLVIASSLKKWVLYRIGHGSDHMLHHEQIGIGDLATSIASQKDVGRDPLLKGTK